MTKPIIFGTDGWRALIAEDFTFANLEIVARATARYLKERGHLGTALREVYVGYDRRFLSKEFAHCVGRVLSTKGFSVQIANVAMPTPALSVLVVQNKSPLGVMITASHNPALYNGYKLKDEFGRSAPPEITQSIEQMAEADQDSRSADNPTAPAASTASAIKTFDPMPDYLRYLRTRLDWKVLNRFHGRVVFDHLHGVGSGIPERLLKNTRLDVFSIHDSYDPLFGGLHPEPIEENLEALKKEVRKRHALIGIALDGDADRLGIVDDEGKYWTPHQVFPLLVLHCIEHKHWKGKIVQSVSLGALGERIAKAFGLPFEEVPVGFKYVAERMLREDILAGGEESGGYAVRGGIPERDGILSGLLVLEMIAARGLKPSKLLKDMESRFGRARFRRIDMALERTISNKADFVAHISAGLPSRLAGIPVVESRTADGLKVILKGGSWVLLRPSGTEPLMRIYAETDDWSTTASLLKWAGQAVHRYFADGQRAA